jgi:heat shock protein HslJ
MRTIVVSGTGQSATLQKNPGTRWAVQSIDGEAAPTRAPKPVATLFMADNGGIGGTQACNSVGGAYAHWTKNGGFKGMDGPIMFTAMGCGGDDGAWFAERFWKLMGDAASWQRNGTDLVIVSNGGSEARLRLIEEVR